MFERFGLHALFKNVLSVLLLVLALESLLYQRFKFKPKALPIVFNILI